jgi:hypothetical protein
LGPVPYRPGRGYIPGFLLGVIWTGWTPLDTDLDVSLMPVAVEVWTRWTGWTGVLNLLHKKITNTSGV